MSNYQPTTQELVRINWIRADRLLAVYDFLTPEGMAYLPMRGFGTQRFVAFIRDGQVVSFPNEKDAFDWLREQGWEHIPDVE